MGNIFRALKKSHDHSDQLIKYMIPSNNIEYGDFRAHVT